MRDNRGFTLIEMTIVAVIVIVLTLMVLGVFIQNLNAWRLEEGLTEINASTRNAQVLMFQDLAGAASVNNNTVASALAVNLPVAGLTELEVLDAFGNPVAPATLPGPGVRFQIPLLPDVTAVPADQNGDGIIDMIDALLFFPDTLNGLNWTTPITIRLRNEDLNGDLLLSGGEDANANGALDRVIERLQDGIGGLPPNGFFTDPGETRTIANNINGLTFQLGNVGGAPTNQLNVTITSLRRLDGPDGNSVTDTLSFSVDLVN